MRSSTSSRARCSRPKACRWAWSPRSTASPAFASRCAARRAMPAPCPWHLRRDALAAAAECVLAVEAIAIGQEDLVGTVGRIEAKPGAINVIPGEVRFTIDIRSPDDALRERAVQLTRLRIGQIADQRHVDCEIELLQDFGSSACAPWLMRPARARGRGARRARAAAAERRRPRRHGDQGDRGHRHAVRALQGRREPQSGGIDHRGGCGDRRRRAVRLYS